jgi:hypothetical protein
MNQAYRPDFEYRPESENRMYQDNYDLVVLLLDTGARYGEITNINWSAIDLDKGTINLWRPKVRNESIIYMTTRVKNILTRRYESRVSETVTVMINQVNKAPSVVINEHDVSVNETESLTLRPTVTEPDGDPVTYMWEQTSGPTATLIDADKASVEVVMPEVASDSSIEIKLTISDGEYSKSVVTSIDIINVEPIQTAPPNQEKESSGGGGTMGWMLLLMIMISFRHLRFVKW